MNESVSILKGSHTTANETLACKEQLQGKLEKKTVYNEPYKESTKSKVNVFMLLI